MPQQRDWMSLKTLNSVLLILCRLSVLLHLKLPRSLACWKTRSDASIQWTRIRNTNLSVQRESRKERKRSNLWPLSCELCTRPLCHVFCSTESFQLGGPKICSIKSKSEPGTTFYDNRSLLRKKIFSQNLKYLIWNKNGSVIKRLHQNSCEKNSFAETEKNENRFLKKQFSSMETKISQVSNSFVRHKIIQKLNYPTGWFFKHLKQTLFAG